ncbi:VWA domain-containing protein [Candidatus Poribacteria bacterium]|nr:VWA domain-containing protein [Candidatus Poribacteria bacterium]
MKTAKRMYRTWKTKSVTRKALSISLIFHLFFLVTTFYVVVQNQPIASEKASLAAELISVEHTARPKPPLKKISQRFHTPSRELTDVSTGESPPSLASPVAVPNETQRVAVGRSLQAEVETEKPSAALDLSEKNWGDVSTAARTLRNVEGNLSKKEAASPAGDTTFGAKRSGPPRVQRAPQISTLKIVEEEQEEEISAALLEEIREKRKELPKASFPKVMKKLAQEIVATSEGGPIDVVFVIDASGSMGDNIRAVTEHLKEMVDIYKASKIDYALGVTEFWASKDENKIKVTQLTRSFTEYKRTLQQITTHHDENALDAVVQTVKELRFRATSKKHFILVTDEPFTSRMRLTVADAIAHCREFGIYVNVLGLPLDEHRTLAVETGGKWHLIPEKPRPQMARVTNRAVTQRSKTVSLRNAQWTDVHTKIGSDVLKHSAYTPVDIILFVDSSESMDDKLPNFLKQLEVIIRDWDNALIDYQIGVVRFRSRASVNMINVYNPPQTLKQIRKIVELPCKEDEMLLDAVAEGLRRLKLRSNAQPYFILVTDEPAEGAYSSLAVIQMLEQKRVLVSVVGTYDDFQQKVATKTGGVWVPIPEGQTKNNSYW